MLIDIQMINKRLRIIFSVTQEEYDKIKTLSGIATISAFVRSRIFGSTVETNRDEDIGLKKWIDCLLQIEQRDKIMGDIEHFAKEHDMKTFDVLYRRLTK